MEKHVIILLADDDADDRELFVDAVHEVDNSIQCFTVPDGQRVLKFLNEHDQQLPDFIFLDLRMPKMSGRNCLREIRSDKRFENIPVIVYSTSDDVEDSKDLEKLGAAHFITKPTNPEEIYFIVSQVLNENWV